MQQQKKDNYIISKLIQVSDVIHVQQVIQGRQDVGHVTFVDEMTVIIE